MNPHPETCRCRDCDPDDARDRKRELEEGVHERRRLGGGDGTFEPWPVGGPEGWVY